MTRLKVWTRDALSVLLWLGRILSGRPAPQGVRILLYHAIATVDPPKDRWRMTVPPSLLAAHLAWLRRHSYVFVSLDEALDMVRGVRPMPAKVVAVTFDDGFRDTLTEAHLFLRRDGVPATVFVVSGYLDSPRPFPWLDRAVPFERPLTWDELRALAGSDLVSVGSHTSSHHRLSDLSLEEQRGEIEGSKSALETGLRCPITWFAYPYGNHGSFSDDTIACLERAGFKVACTNVMGVNRPGDSPWILRRTRIGWEDRLWRFRLKMHGLYDWVDRCQGRRIRAT